MQAEKNFKVGSQKKTGIRILKSVLALSVILILLVVFLLPALVSSERGRRTILAKINNSIDGEIDFAALSMSWFKGLKVTDFSFNDGTGQTSLSAKQIITKPHYISILIGSLSFGKTIIDRPKVEINLKAQQTNKAKDRRHEASVGKKSQPVTLPIKEINLVVNDGNLKVIDSKTETANVVGIDSKIIMSFHGEYSAGQTETLLANLSTKAKLGFEKAGYMGWNLGPAEVEIQIKNGLLRIAPFSTTVNNGQFNFTGQADFKHKPALLETVGPIQVAKDIKINDEIAEKLLIYLNPVFANAVNVSGVVSFSCERLAIPLGEASQNDIEVIGTVSINQLRLQASDLLGQILTLVGATIPDQDIVIHPTRFALQNGFLQYDNMQMDIGDNPVNFKGVIGLDKSLNMAVTLPYTLKGRTARVGRETVGQRISLPLRGTTDKPELDVGRLLQEQLKSQFEEQLREKALEVLEELFE